MQNPTPPGYQSYPSTHMNNQSNERPQGYDPNYPNMMHQQPTYNNGGPNYSYSPNTPGHSYINERNPNNSFPHYPQSTQVHGYYSNTFTNTQANAQPPYQNTYTPPPPNNLQAYQGNNQLQNHHPQYPPNPETNRSNTAQNPPTMPPLYSRNQAPHYQTTRTIYDPAYPEPRYQRNPDTPNYPRAHDPNDPFYQQPPTESNPTNKVSTETSDANEDFIPSFVKRLTASVSNDIIQVPRPQTPNPNNEMNYEKKIIDKDFYVSPPPSNNRFEFCDKGSSSMRFARLTLATCPGLTGSQFSTNIPFSCIVQPFADQSEMEMPIPLIDLTPSSLPSPGTADQSDMGPVRCMRCKAYINPFTIYEKAKNVFVCNLCGYQSKVPDFYNPLLESGQNRVDKLARAEMSYGSVDFVASKAYAISVPKPPRFCIIIENTYTARYMNLTNCVINAIQQALPQINSPYFEISIITYDETIQFYALEFSKGTPQWKLLVVSDVDSPFIPAPVDSLFVNVTENLDDLNNLLSLIPTFTSEKSATNSAGNAALFAAVNLISNTGTGLINWFCCSSPDVGMGALKVDPKAKEKLTPELLNTQFYTSLLYQCYKYGISIDLHCYPAKNTSINLYSLSYPATESGGKVYYTKDFEWDKDYDKIYYDLLRSLQKPTGFDCSVKVRTAKGLSVNKLYTPYTNPLSMADVTSFKAPKLDADSAFAIEIKIEETMNDVEYVYVQIACLYTTLMGTKQIRVHTLAINVANTTQMLFRNSDLDSLVNYLARITCSEILKGKTNWKETINSMVTDILHSYRSNIPPKPNPEQLFLPDALKLLPLYYSCLIRNVACRQYKSLGDEQLWYIHNFLSNPCMYTLPMLYPRIFPMHRSFTKKSKEIANLPKIGQYSTILEAYYYPETIPARGDMITTDGVYIFDIANIIILYVGNDVSPEYISQVFGPEAAANDIPPSEWKIIDDDPDSQGALINKLIKQIQSERRTFSYPVVRMILPKTNQEETLRKYLVEDSIPGYSGYTELLGEFHKAIIHKMHNY